MSKEQKTLTLTLPYIELQKDKPMYDCESYDKSGTYFVKSPQGEFCIVEVCKENRSAFGNPLTMNVGNLFSEQIAENRLEERLDSMNEELKNTRKELMEPIIHKIFELNESIEGLFIKTGDKLGLVYSTLLDITDGMARIEESKSKESTPQSNMYKGSISEDALVQLVKEIKK